MDVKKTLNVGLVTVALLAPGTVFAGTRHNVPLSPGRPATTVPAAADVITKPVLWLLGAIGVPVEAPAPMPNAQVLERERGWQTLEFPLGDVGVGVYLEVRGRVQFDRAEIRLADGSTHTVALHESVRGSGLYELLALNELARVEAVVLRAQARSASSEVGVRLGRMAP